MKNRFLYALWGALFILCAALGFIPEPAGAGKLLLTVLSIAFFVPPAALIWKGRRQADPATTAVVRNLSIVSLTLTAALLIANFLTVFRSDLLGNLLHGVLVVVSSPMICSGHWALSLFLWACLLIASCKPK